MGRWLSAMDWNRRETLSTLKDVSDDALDVRVDASPNTIGTLLYHVALVEADWLLDEILEDTVPPPKDLLPFVHRDDEGILTAVEGTTLAEHLERLAAVRSLVNEHLGAMASDDFHRLRKRERYDVSPDWVLYHLIEHEAEHRSQIAGLRNALNR